MMRVDSSFGEHDRQGFDADLRSILIGCQRYSRARQEACDPDVQASLHEDYRAYLVQLYQLLEPDPVSYTHLTLPRSTLCRSRWSPYH